MTNPQVLIIASALFAIAGQISLSHDPKVTSMEGWIATGLFIWGLISWSS